MNRHERRRAAATGKRSDVSWSRQDGNAYRDRLAQEHGRTAVLAVLERMAADDDAGPLVGLILDTEDMAAHYIRSQLGIAAETSRGVVAGSVTLDAALDFLATWNEAMEAGDVAALRLQLEADEDHVPVLVVGGCGSGMWRFRRPEVDDDDQDAEPARVLS